MEEKKSGNAFGRPKKYSKKALAEAIEGYFDSICVMREERGADGLPLVNIRGEEIKRRIYVVPPTVSGLCQHLGIDRRTWVNYCDERKNAALSAICEAARERIEAYLEEELLTREKGLQGVIFNLQNNYNWKERREVELGEDTRKDAAAAKDMSLYDKIALIASAQAQVGEVDEYRHDEE